MLLTFDNHYVIAVIVFMVAMLFCKNMLECIHVCIQVSQAFVCEECFICPCIHLTSLELLRLLMLRALLVFAIFQPVILLLVKKTAESFQQHKSMWTVNAVDVMLHPSAFKHSTNTTAEFQVFPNMAQESLSLSLSEIDVVLVVMPFTLISASSTWTWVSLQHQDFFTGDPEWAPELFCDQRMFLYELLYSVEVFALLCALLFITADPAPVGYIIVYSLLMTFLLLFFFSHSRQQKNADTIDNAIAMIIFSLLSSLISFFVVQNWSGPCPTKRSSGLLLVFVVVTLAIIHTIAREGTRAGSIILLRTVVSFTCSLYFVLIVGQNPNAWCVQDQ